MRAIPAEVGARWGAMWAKGHVPDRPWWSRHDLTYRRCDGITILSRVFMDITHGDERGLWDGKEPYADAMARIDAAHPLPAPGPLPGQVWAFVRPGYGDGWGYHLVTVTAAWIDGAWLVHLGGDSVTVATYREKEARPGENVWPLTGAILVAGPAPWGRDIPWSPA